MKLKNWMCVKAWFFQIQSHNYDGYVSCSSDSTGASLTLLGRFAIILGMKLAYNFIRVTDCSIRIYRTF